MTIDEFERNLKACVQNFFDTYRDGAEFTPDQYPLEMDEGEWWEQFTITNQ